MPNTLGERLAQARRELGVREHRDISRLELAKAVGVDSSMISQYESNAKVPREDTLGRLAAYLGVTPSFLRYGVAPAEPFQLPPNATDLRSFPDPDATPAEVEQPRRRRPPKAAGDR